MAEYNCRDKFESFWNNFHKDYDDLANRIPPIMLNNSKQKPPQTYICKPAYRPIIFLSCAED
jgi:hypothetical protein